MSGRRKDKPAHNYAKPVDQFPPLRKEVTDTLSNQYSMSNLSHSGKESSDKVYFILHNQAYYRGQWVDGLPHGLGFCVYADGSYYEGNFVEGEANAEKGLLVLPNGAFYLGEVKRSMIEGKGVMKHNIDKDQSYEYDGYWKDGKPHGQGIEKYGDNSYYKGHFQNGVKHFYDPSKTLKEKAMEFEDDEKLKRYPIYISPATQESYRGEFVNGLMHGFGDYYRQDNKIRYTGQFANGKKQGNGSLHTEKGVLSGQFDNDLINGQGRFEWDKKDGKVYIGNFRNSKFHGQGRIEYPNGNVLYGTWEDGHNLELKQVKKKGG